MARTIRVSLSFDFEPEGEHDFLFEDMTEDQILESCLDMAYEDALRAERQMFTISVLEED